MMDYPLSLSNELFAEIHQLAAASEMSLDQWLLAAITDKISADRTQRLLDHYALQSDEARFQHILARVPDASPLPGDEL